MTKKVFCIPILYKLVISTEEKSQQAAPQSKASIFVDLETEIPPPSE